MKANTPQADADVKEKWFICRCRPSGRWGIHISKPSSWKMGTHVTKPTSISHWRQNFYKEGEGSRTKRSRKGVEKFSTCRPAQSTPIRPVMVRCAASWFSRPGFMSSHLHVILDPWLKASKPLRMGCSKVGVCIF